MSHQVVWNSIPAISFAVYFYFNRSAHYLFSEVAENRVIVTIALLNIVHLRLNYAIPLAKKV